MFADFGETEMEVILILEDIVFSVTITLHVPVTLPSFAAEAVMVASPFAIAVISPLSVTVATAVLFEFHVIVLSVAFSGSTV